MLEKLADKLGRKWLRLLLVVGLAGIVALSGCTFRGEGEADEKEDEETREDTATIGVRGEGSPGLAGIAALGALGGVAYAARRRMK